MGDQFEKFIIENREEFNDTEPTDKIWARVEKNLNKKKTYFSIAWKVVAMIFMASTLYLILDRSSQSVTGPVLSDEFEQAEDYYVKLISLRKQEIKEKLTPENQDQFLRDIDQLDSMYLELKQTYQTNASNARVVDAMISNLQLRLKILNKQLEVLENIKDQNSEMSESSTQLLST